MDITFTAEKKKFGNSYSVIIPKPFADLMKKGEKYLFTIKECENDKNSKINLD